MLETDGSSQARLELWHVKPSHGDTAGTRVTDIEVVGAQASKSRRWFTDPDLFTEMHARFTGKKPPRLTVIDGDEDLLGELLAAATDERPWTLASARPVVRGQIVIAQPGLSWGLLTQRASQGDDLSAQQVGDLLTSFAGTLGSLADALVLCSA